MNRYLGLGLTALAGAALLETALIPGLVIGGAAVLAPKLLPEARRRLQPLVAAVAGKQNGPAQQHNKVSPDVNGILTSLGIKQAVAKTITFRIIVTVLDFTSNYIVIGEVTTAAGLSTFALVVGPLFYLGHEAAWNYLGPPETETISLRSLLPLPAGGVSENASGLTISRALAKTITFRTIATAMDFTTLYVVVGDLATAAGLSAFGFVVGPFVYYGHEKLWDYYSAPRSEETPQSDNIRHLPARS